MFTDLDIQENMGLISNKTTFGDVQENMQDFSSSDVCDSQTSSRKFIGVSKRGNRYSVRIWNPIRKKDERLGTFESAEEASMAYLTKKTEFEELRKGQKGIQGVVCDEGIKDENDSRISKRKKVCHGTEKKMVGVNKTKNGKYTARIRHPISKKYISLETFRSEEEAAMVYLAKKTELENEVKGKKVIQGVVFDDGIKKVVDQLDQCLGDNDSDPCLENQVSSLLVDSGKVKLKKKMVGVNKTRNGKYGARIRHPLSKKEIWLGRSHEEAAKVYLAKKTEFEKGSQSNEEGIEFMVCKDNGIKKSTDQLDSIDIQKNGELEKELQGTEGIQQVVSKDNEIGKSSDQLVPILQENSHEPCSDNQDSAMLIDSFDGESDSGMVNTLIQKNGGSELSTESGAEILLRTESGEPIMDSHGFLLGNWSFIDDLSLPTF